MTAAAKRDPGAAPQDRKSEPTAASGFVVSRRRTVQVAGRLLRPGTPVDLPHEELVRLEKAGFVTRDGNLPETGGGVRVGRLQIKGGRKPGGQVA